MTIKVMEIEETEVGFTLHFEGRVRIAPIDPDEVTWDMPNSTPEWTRYTKEQLIDIIKTNISDENLSIMVLSHVVEGEPIMVPTPPKPEKVSMILGTGYIQSVPKKKLNGSGN